MRTSSSSASSQVANAPDPARLSSSAQGARDDRCRHVQQRTAAVQRAQHGAHDVVVRQRLGSRELVARVLGARSRGAARAPLRGAGYAPVAVARAAQLGDHAIGDVLGPDRLNQGPPAPRHGHHRQQRQALQQRQPRVPGRVDDRWREHRRPQACLADRLLGERLGAEEAGAMVSGGVERREEQEAFDSRALRSLDHAPGGDPVELLDRAARLIADRSRQVHDRADAPQRVPKRRRVGEVAERDLHPHALCAEPARVAHEAAHLRAFGDEAAQERRPDHAGGAGEQQHDQQT